MVTAEKIAQKATLSCDSDDCISPYLVYNKLVMGGAAPHIGFFRVRFGEAKSYGLTKRGNVRSPDPLLYGDDAKQVPPGKNATLIGTYAISNTPEFDSFLSCCIAVPSNYSALEMNGGINCATFVENAIHQAGVPFDCSIPILSTLHRLRIPLACRKMPDTRKMTDTM